MRFFEYFRDLTEPLRVPDLHSYMKSQGLPELRLPMTLSSLLTAPIRHRGEGAGSIYLVNASAEGEFTREDEETVALFASQAALVIANARRHREEQRARADLDALNQHITGGRRGL